MLLAQVQKAVRAPVRAGVVYLRPKQVAFIRSVGPYATSSRSAWKNLLAWIDRNRLEKSVVCGYGLALDHPQATSPEDCRYDACIELPDGFIPRREDNLPLQTLDGGAYARFRHVGDYNRVRSTVTRLREEWLAAQPNLLLDRRRPLLTIYFDYPGRTQAEEALRCDVCLPVRTEHSDAFARRKFPTPEDAADANANANGQ